jgi:Galactose oxidase, central domain/Kelch motif
MSGCLVSRRAKKIHMKLSSSLILQIICHHRQDSLAGLVSATSIPASRFLFTFLLLGTVLLGQPCANASGVFTNTGSLGTERARHTATLLPNDKVLVAGGINDDNGYLASGELYDPASGNWTVTGSLLTARDLHTATLLPNGKVLVAGGSNDTSPRLASAELYDPASGAWTATGSLLTARHSHTATLLPNGKVLVAGGITNAGASLASAELYDPASGTWTATDSLTTAREGHTATLLSNGKVLVTGGFNLTDFYLASAELYDPASGTWSATGSLATAHIKHTATLLPNGKVLVAGGSNGTSTLGSAELYDPANGIWTATGNLLSARHSYAAALLPNGTVLAAGGFGTDDSLASAELYDPASGTWTATGSLTTKRDTHTATLLSNSQVLVAGGRKGGCMGICAFVGALASAELYGGQPAQLLNIATRLRVQTGENVLIGGFIITGTDPKRVIVLGVGPSLAQFFSGSLSNPTLELYQGDTVLQMNDDWKTDQQAEIEATGLAPTNDLESAVVRTLDPGSYTAILRGKGDATGIGVVQAYDLNQAANSKFGNIATRGFVDNGDNVMIGGFIIGPAGGATTVVVRAIGPSLANFGINGALQDPTLELHDGNGATIASNDNWQDDPSQSSIPQSLQPGDPRESALFRVLASGSYTGVVRGAANSTGVGLVEVYNIQ